MRRIDFVEVGDNIVLVENAIQDDEHDWEEECEERRDLGEGVGSFNLWVDDSFIEEHKTLKVGVRDVLNLKEAAITNIILSSFDMIYSSICSLGMFFWWYSCTISTYILIALALGMQLYKKRNMCSFS